MKRNKAFTIIEAIVAMLVVAVCTMSIIEALKMGDDLSLRAKIDSRGHQEFAKQSKWVAEYPSSSFASIIQANGGGAYTETSLGTASSPPKILIPQPYAKLVPMEGAFAYNTTLTVTPPQSANSPYVVSVLTTWESPVSTLDISGSAVTNSMEIKNFNKW